MHFVATRFALTPLTSPWHSVTRLQNISCWKEQNNKMKRAVLKEEHNCISMEKIWLSVVKVFSLIIKSKCLRGKWVWLTAGKMRMNNVNLITLRVCMYESFRLILKVSPTAGGFSLFQYKMLKSTVTLNMVVRLTWFLLLSQSLLH